MNKLIIVSIANTESWPATPSAVRGNIVIQSNGQNFAFGYLRLAEIDIKDYTIK